MLSKKYMLFQFTNTQFTHQNMFITKAKDMEDMEDMVETAVIMKSRLNIMEVEEMVNIENSQTSPEQEAKIVEKKLF